MKHWISFLTIANANLGDSSFKDLRQENAELEKALSSACSWSPRGKGLGKNQQQALPALLQQIALPAVAHSGQKENRGGKGSEGKQSGGKGNKSGKGNGQEGSRPRHDGPGQSFRFSLVRHHHDQGGGQQTALLNQQFCHNFQSGRCVNTAFPEIRACVGCGVYGKAFNSCGCLESRAA